MDTTGKFLLPSPKFKKLDKPSTATPHFLSPQGMLLPKEQQPPPMYGPRGATLPPKFLGPQRVPSTSNQAEKSQKYFCEPCQAEFHTSTDYKVHKSEHSQCQIDECSFRGHRSFMDTHIAQQHSTGLYDQLKKLSTPEEIAQWKADRRKNYPTVASVAQERKAREQRMLRGEKLGGNKSRFGRHSDRRPMRGDKQEVGAHVEKPESNKSQRKRTRPVKQGPRRGDKKVVEQKLVEKEEDEEPTCGGLKMFKGTGEMPDYKKAKKVESHALSSLLGMYGSDSEDETEKSDVEEEEVDQIVQHTDKLEKEDAAVDQKAKEIKMKGTLESKSHDDESTPQETSDAPAKNLPEPTEASEPPVEPAEPHSSDDEAPEEAPIAKSSSVPDKPQTEQPRKKHKQNPPKRTATKSGLDYRKLRGGRQNTMLEKLLEPDIRHERNVLLQCVRFVVENNFFGIGSSPSQPQP